MSHLNILKILSLSQLSRIPENSPISWLLFYRLHLQSNTLYMQVNKTISQDQSEYKVPLKHLASYQLYESCRVRKINLRMVPGGNERHDISGFSRHLEFFDSSFFTRRSLSHPQRKEISMGLCEFLISYSKGFQGFRC